MYLILGLVYRMVTSNLKWRRLMRVCQIIEMDKIYQDSLMSNKSKA